MTDIQAVTYSAVLEAIRLGVQHAKGMTVEAQEITDSTGLWVGEDLDRQCLYLDSLDLLELVVFLEKEFGWMISEEQIDAQGWQTVGDLASVIMNIANDVSRDD